jgi:16S rRNA G966 N2-methylase RsmD
MPGALSSESFRIEEPAVLFLDPPYKKDLARQTLEALAELPSMRQPGHVCVVQTEKEAILDAEVAQLWTLRRRYSYGSTVLGVYDAAL